MPKEKVGPHICFNCLELCKCNTPSDCHHNCEPWINDDPFDDLYPYDDGDLEEDDYELQY